MTASHKKIIYTIGHSTHPIQEFIDILTHYKINHVVDIRTVPKSRHNPQFNKEDLHASLHKAYIKYTHLKELCGFRKVSPDSINTAWRNASFRGFADYMQTEEFSTGIEKLLKIASHDTTVIMCAEAVPWRCHRSLIGDALVIRNIDVEDIYTITSAKPHKLTPWAQVKDHKITYPEKK